MVKNSVKDCIEGEEKVTAAVTALKNLCEKYSSRTGDGKKALFNTEENGNIFLNISMKKIPFLHNSLNINIPLPHPCWSDLEDICLFVPDLDKRKPDDDVTIHHYRILLQNQNIDVSEIITLHQLRSEYQTYESRNRLVGSYGIFLCDGRLSKMMPSLLGKIFIKKRKIPISVDLRTQSLAKKIKGAISKTKLSISGHGTSSTCQVGNITQSVNDITSNVIAAVKELEKKLPGGSANIASLHIKTPRSLSVPIYISLELPNELQLPVVEEKEKPVIDELTTADGKGIMVYPSGRVVYFPSDLLEGNEADDAEVEKKILKSARSTKKGPSRSSARKKRSKTNAITKKKESHEAKTKIKKMGESARLVLRSSQKYKLKEHGQKEKSPFARLVSVKKKKID